MVRLAGVIDASRQRVRRFSRRTSFAGEARNRRMEFPCPPVDSHAASGSSQTPSAACPVPFISDRDAVISFPASVRKFPGVRKFPARVRKFPSAVGRFPTAVILCPAAAGSIPARVSCIPNSVQRWEIHIPLRINGLWRIEPENGYASMTFLLARAARAKQPGMVNGK